MQRLATVTLVVLVLVSCRQETSKEQSSDNTLTEASQDSTKKTKLERFAAKHGVAVVRGFTDIGELPGEYGGSVEIGAAELMNAASGEKARGIWIQVKEGGSLERENTFVD